MSKNPINLALRFLLEIMALVSLGIFGVYAMDGAMGVVAAVSLPLCFAVVWGVFAVRGDPSRSGKTVVATPGPVRLILELLLFAASVLALYSAGFDLLALIFGVAVVLHYLLSFDRIRWLLNN